MHKILRESAISILIILIYFGVLSATSMSVQALEQASLKKYGLSMAGLEDNCTFDLYQKGKILTATMRYARDQSGKISNVTTIYERDGATKVRTSILPDPDGAWERVDMITGHGEIHIDREGLLVSSDVMGEKSRAVIDEGSVLYDDGVPALVSDIVQRYNQGVAGTQEISLFSPLFPMEYVRVTFLEEERHNVDGLELKLYRYQLAFPEVEKTVWVDESSRLILLKIPSEDCCCVRRGYESVFKQKMNT